MNFSAQTFGIIEQIIANVIWGGSSVVVKLALKDLSPYTFIFLRMFIALLLLTPFIYPKLKENKIRIKDMPVVFLSGFFGITLNIGLFFLGLNKTTVIDASVIAATTSLFTAFAAFLFLKEKISKIMLAGMFVSFLGVITIIVQPIFENGLFQQGNILGNIFILGATWAWVGYTILNKKIRKKYNCWVLSYYSFAIGCLSFLPLSLKDILNPNFFSSLSAFSWFAIVFEAIFPTIIAYYFFSWSLKYVSATSSAVIAYIHPIVAILSSIIFLHEKITLPFIAGTVLVAAGLFLSEAKHKLHPLHFLHKK